MGSFTEKHVIIFFSLIIHVPAVVLTLNRNGLVEENIGVLQFFSANTATVAPLSPKALILLAVAFTMMQRRIELLKEIVSVVVGRERAVPSLFIFVLQSSTVQRSRLPSSVILMALEFFNRLLQSP